MEIPLEEHIRTVTTKGQVTIPVEVRKLLGIEPQDKVVFQVQNGRVELRPVMTLEEVCGLVPPLKQPLSDDELREIIDKERAARWLANNA
jgi:AbrB family looped-hinge helix DNA binding protein